MIGEPDIIVAEDVLSFAGVEPPTLRVYPLETHLAEKLHAYTLPRSRPKSRVKDLPDIALLATVREIEAKQLRAALEQTFESRKTHPIPSALPAPPSTWSGPYERMAGEDELPWADLAILTRAASAFFDPVLGGADGMWFPAHWSWSIRPAR